MVNTSLSLESLITIEIKDALKAIAEKEGINDATINVQHGSTLGDNYLGVIVGVVVTGKSENGQEKSLDIVLKCAPRNENFREALAMDKIYYREMYAYETLFKELLNIQKEKSIKDVFCPFAGYYRSVYSVGFETLMMKDMKKLGYSMQDRRKPLDYSHLCLTMRFYGKLHALSFAIRDQKPELFRKLADNLQENFISNTPQEYYETTATHVLDILDGSLRKKFESFASKLHKIIPYEISEEPAGKYAVLCHGDCWTNNILYKYEDTTDPKKPTGLIFLDWQLCRAGSPVLDLSYFLCVCTDKELRDKHYWNLIDEYYDSLSSFLRELGSDPDVLFPRRVLDEHLKRFVGFGIYMAISVLKLMLSDKDEIPDFKNMNEEELQNSAEDAKTMNIKAKGEYEERIRDLISDFTSYGYVEFNS